MDKEIDIEHSLKKEEDKLLSETFDDKFRPVQRNSELFKFILYTSKVEIKSNSFMRMVLVTSLVEISVWWVGLMLFITKPSTGYVVWIEILHLIKGVLGLMLLHHFPKTFEVIENLEKNPDFNEDKITELIKNDIKESFMDKWAQNKTKLFFYFLINLLCLVIDIILVLVVLFLFGEINRFLMQTTMMFSLAVYIISDVVYLLWFLTLRFTFPPFMVSPINSAIIGSLMDLRGMLFRFFSKSE